MDVTTAQNVLRCAQCNKPFDKQSTLKRHGYYCRSRKGISTTRARSCVACATGKARCDNRWPECSRCVAKGVECRYPEKISRSQKTRIQQQNHTPITQENSASLSMPDPYPPIIEESHQSSNNAIPTLEDVLAIPDADFNFGPGIFDWPGNDIDFTNFLDQPQEALDLESHPAIASPSDLVRTDTAPDEQIISRHQAISMRNLPRIPALHIRSLVPKERLQRGAQRTTNLILHTLRSYPQMMMRHDLLPPFIHPESISPSSSEKSMEPLVNCISLVQMISSKVRGSRKLFWKNVRLECERICAEHVDLTRWQLLTAMQAVCIYTIIRLDEGETDDNNCDFLLLTTTAVIAKQIMCIETQCTKKEAPCSYGGKPCWQDWIYEESRRRLSIVMRIIGMLVYFEPTNMCTLQSDLILAPLPGRKHLWEAKDEATWDTERERDSNMMDAFALAASGDLVKLNEGQAFCGDALLYYKNSDTSNVRERNLANWDEWCSGMDGFGGLVMLAASLVG